MCLSLLILLKSQEKKVDYLISVFLSGIYDFCYKQWSEDLIGKDAKVASLFLDLFCCLEKYTQHTSHGLNEFIVSCGSII